MVFPHKIMPQMKKAISALQAKPDLWGGDGSNRKLNVEVLEEIAANHLFDKLHDLLGITERNGLCIMAYFQDVSARSYQFVVDLHKAFPSLANERQEYVSRVNYYRSLHRLPQVNLPTEKRPVMKRAD
jgi:hypothetical protein